MCDIYCSDYVLSVPYAEFKLPHKHCVLRENFKSFGLAELRKEIRKRPKVGDALTVIEYDCPGTNLLTRVKEVNTVAVFFEDNHPLWINGEPVRHIAQEEFARDCGHDSWAECEFYIRQQYGGSEFNGYAVFY